MRSILCRVAAVLAVVSTLTSTRIQAAPSPEQRAATRTPAAILAGANLKNPDERARVVVEMQAAERVRYEAVLTKAAQLGVPVRKDGPGHQVAILHSFRGDLPIYRKTMNRNAAISSAANLVGPAPYNLNGTGIKVGVWDAGSVRRTHQEFTLGRVTNINTVATDDHSTHVAGTIGAAGITNSARGMATNVVIASYDWEDDYSEMTGAGAATATQSNKLPISNHSYGYTAQTADMGVYNDEAVTMDALLVGLPYYLPFWAAGNEQDELTAKGGYQSITYLGLAKNLITIGAVNDAVSGTNRSLGGATIAYFSSLGPSDDGRIKPDVVANGIDLNSTVDTSDTAYDSYSGTSMATPSSAGSAALLAQLHRREFSGQFMRASMLKALLIHTADDIGTAGPDYTFGWGLINTKAAADVILAHKNSPGAPKMIETNITTTVTSRSYSFKWDGSSPIRATLAWTDPAGTARNDNDRNPVLVNNLDLRIIAPNSTVYLPYVMPFSTNFTDANFGTAAIKGSNRVDNVERVDIPTPPGTGTYSVVVSLGGSLSGGAPQTFSLILTGSIGTDIPPQIASIDPITVVNGREVAFPVIATDPADSDPITLTYANLPSGATFGSTNGNGYFSWSVATPNDTYTPRFIATDKDGSVTQTVSITVVDNAPPVLAPIGDKTTIISNLLTFAVNATDPIGSDPITLTASNLPAGATFGATNGTGTFTWANPAPVGVYPVTFFAADMTGTVSEIIYITVKPTPIYVYGTNSTSITIPESGKATPYPSQINIAGAVGLVERVIVNLNNFSHLYPADLDIILVGPQGQKSVVMGAVGGGSAVLNLNLTVDDLAEAEMSTPLTSGTWKPSGATLEAIPAPAPGLPYETSFTNFIGTEPNGTWSLYVHDYETPDNGNISGGWSLQIQVLVPTNSAPTITVTNPAPIPVGSDFELAVTANDLTDNDVITLSADELPLGAVFASVTNAGTVSGTMVWSNAGPIGADSATFRATDKDGSRTVIVPLEVFLPPPPAPASLWISDTNNYGFTAEWSSVAEADTYRLDVSANPAFENVSEIGTPTTILYHSGTPGTGTGGTWIEDDVGGTTYLIMIENTSRVISPSALFIAGVADSLTFQARTYGGVNAANNTITVSISTNAGTTWTVLGTRIPVSSTLSTMTPFDLGAYDGKQIAIKFETLGASGSVGAGIRQIDLKSLVYEVIPDYVTGYSNRTVITTSEIVTNLVPNQTYYARVRAVNDGGASANSSTASVTTTFSPEPPVFISSAGPFTNQTGVTFALPVSASGLPAPVISLEATTASSGYNLTSNTLTYTPPLADIGDRTFTLIASNTVGAATQTVTVVVTEGPPPPPAAIWASVTNTTDFTATWSEVVGATSYRLDVATNSVFVGGSTSATELFLSEYIEGSSNNKAIEIFNGTGAPINLSAGNYTIRFYFNGNTSFSTITLTGTIAAGDVFVLANSSANAAILAKADQTSGNVTHNGNDVVALAKNGANIDVIGTIGSSANFAVDVTLVRVSSVSAGTTTYTPSEWTTQLTDTTSFLGSHTYAGGAGAPAYVPGYSNLTVAGTSQLVSGLVENRTYYFRARAVNDDGESANSPTGSVTTTTTGGGGGEGGSFTNILFQGFEPGDGWTIVSGAGRISGIGGGSDTPANQRIRTGTNSWQVSNVNTNLNLANASIVGYTGRQVRVFVSSTSGTAGNGAEASDVVRVFVSLDGAAVSATPDLVLAGNNNARWGFNATNIMVTTAGTLVSNQAPQGGTTITNYASLFVNLPNSATSVALRVTAVNNDGNERWNIDDITVVGYSVGGSPDLTPGLVITTANQTVSFSTTSISIGGTSTNLDGQIAWTNNLSGDFGAVAATADWLITGLPLSIGTNAITVSGSNNLNSATSKVVSIIRESDSDGDGIPDMWEEDFFGSVTNVDQTTDWDIDGFIDLHEFLAGTDPIDTNSFLRVVENVSSPSSGIVIQWPGVSGKSYALSKTTNILEYIYSIIASNINGVEPMNIYTDEAPDGASSIYRIELEE